MGIRVALQGEIGSGKSTLAKYMRENHGWYVMEYSDSLKWALCKALNYFEDETGERFDAPDIQADKNRFRKALQELGSALGFDKGVGVETALKDWELYRRSANQPVIFDNVRFEEQFNILKPHGFVLVELFVNYNQRKERATKKGISLEGYGHIAEESCPEPDLYLNANGTVEETAELLLRLNGQHTPRKSKVA